MDGDEKSLVSTGDKYEQLVFETPRITNKRVIRDSLKMNHLRLRDARWRGYKETSREEKRSYFNATRVKGVVIPFAFAPCSHMALRVNRRARLRARGIPMRSL